jgi:hypothetical protein
VIPSDGSATVYMLSTVSSYLQVAIANSVLGLPLATNFDVPSSRRKSCFDKKRIKHQNPGPFAWLSLLNLAVIIPLTNMLTSAFLIPICLSSLVAAQTYVLEDDYEPASFFDMFDFFTVSKVSTN